VSAYEQYNHVNAGSSCLHLPPIPQTNSSSTASANYHGHQCQQHRGQKPGLGPLFPVSSCRQRSAAQQTGHLPQTGPRAICGAPGRSTALLHAQTEDQRMSAWLRLPAEFAAAKIHLLRETKGKPGPFWGDEAKVSIRGYLQCNQTQYIQSGWFQSCNHSHHPFSGQECGGRRRGVPRAGGH
jgi:hypothetical protein